MFSAAWFEAHQAWILRLLSWPLVGRVFRRVLAIRAHDVGYRARIVQLLPHAYTIENGDGTYTTDFRTHRKYAKRLYHAFLPLWQMLHAWDMVIANPLVPALNAGFDTLVIYPDPGSPGSTTVDGQVYRGFVDESFSSIRNGAGMGTSSTVNNTAPQLWASATSNQFQVAQHGVFLFDTSSIGAGVVSAATFSQWITGVTTSLGDTTVAITGGTTASTTTLAAGDYETIGRTSFATIASISGVTTGGYTDSALNASGVASINRSGVTVLETQLGWDLSNAFGGTWASSVATELTIYFADQTGSTNDPKLEVTYDVRSRLRPVNKLRPRVFAPGRAR